MSLRIEMRSRCASRSVRPGGYQARLLCPADTLALVPSGLEIETAGALGLPAVTAWLERVPLAETARAHRMIEAGDNAGRVALVPGE